MDTLINVSSKLSTGTVFALILIGLCIRKHISDVRKQASGAKVPGVGYDSFPILQQWRAAYRFMKDPKKLVVEGYAKYRDGYFRLSAPGYEYVIVSDPEKINEFLTAPEDIMSFIDSSNDAMQIPWTMGWGVAYNHYHTVIVRTKLTQKIQNLVPLLIPEVSDALDRFIGSPKDWMEVQIYNVICESVARVSSKAFVGAPLCYNEEYLKNATDYARDVVVSGFMIRLFPDWIKNFLIKLTPISKRRRLAMKHLSPMVEDRKAIANGERKDLIRPDDMLQWLVEAAPPSEATLERLTELMMALNVASIHTTTMTLTNALYNLAREPEKYMQELRDEIAENSNDDGSIDKTTIGKLRKMDSFLRESGRYIDTGLINLARNVKKPFRFKDGTVIPAGNVLGVPAHSLHRDATQYVDPDVFDGFRFARPQFDENGNEKTTKHQMVSTDLNYLAFGHGKHACPGRFFAVNEMKMILTKLLPRYDIKLIPGTAPKEMWFGPLGIPDSEMKILFKARQ